MEGKMRKVDRKMERKMEGMGQGTGTEELQRGR